MTRPRERGDAGQAFPVYIVVVAGLLLLAFAYLAVGQAAANRNGAQTAADAAALAAAQDTRDQLAGLWRENLLDPATWQDILDGVADVDRTCRRAVELAGQNTAAVESCEPVGLLGYRVRVRTDKSVGESVVPGTERFRSTATATAVIEPLCTVDPPTDDGEPGGEPGGDPGGGDGGTEPGGDEDVVLPSLDCDDGKIWELDPDDLTGLPEAHDLFDVHLSDRPTT
ncbi:pilus assembly protein TadG-related protein [Streptomyces sp. NPDC086091]|uniref:pilus assembly protein TadG-related protein n=1 Tax=Streptomyces sp. NPDC086091 TaxID=3365751 RepID=UPI0037F912CB